MSEVLKEIDNLYQEAIKNATELNKSLIKLRSINYEFDNTNEEELKQAMEIGRDIDKRTAYILRSLLLQHGNVLFL